MRPCRHVGTDRGEHERLLLDELQMIIVVTDETLRATFIKMEKAGNSPLFSFPWVDVTKHPPFAFEETQVTDLEIITAVSGRTLLSTSA